MTLSYNEVNSRAAMQDSGGITTYSYDELNRPKAVAYPGPKRVTYSYDAVGNRATLTDPDGGLTTYSYDSRNLLNWLLNPAGDECGRLVGEVDLSRETNPRGPLVRLQRVEAA